jgi:hypothetical protein
MHFDTPIFAYHFDIFAAIFSFAAAVLPIISTLAPPADATRHFRHY